METVCDFEDILACLEKHKVKYLIVGGLAFIYHAKPRFTKDIDVWIESGTRNVESANRALAKFGSPILLDQGDASQILQIGVAPDRIDFILNVEGVDFKKAWSKRIRDRYGKVEVNWIDIDSLILAKSRINDLRHQEDARILRSVKRLKKKTK